MFSATVTVSKVASRRADVATLQLLAVMLGFVAAEEKQRWQRQSSHELLTRIAGMGFQTCSRISVFQQILELVCLGSPTWEKTEVEFLSQKTKQTVKYEESCFPLNTADEASLIQNVKPGIKKAETSN